METVRGSVWQMQTLWEITERATLRNKNMIMQKYWYISETKYRPTVKIALNMCFTTVLIPTFILLFPLRFVSPYFSIHQDKDGRAMAGRKEGSMAFKALACPETWTASKPGTSRINSQSQGRNRPILKWQVKNKWSADVKKINSWREFWDNSRHLIIHYCTLFFKWCKPEKICHSERNE